MVRLEVINEQGLKTQCGGKTHACLLTDRASVTFDSWAGKITTPNSLRVLKADTSIGVQCW